MHARGGAQWLKHSFEMSKHTKKPSRAYSILLETLAMLPKDIVSIIDTYHVSFVHKLEYVKKVKTCKRPTLAITWDHQHLLCNHGAQTEILDAQTGNSVGKEDITFNTFDTKGKAVKLTSITQQAVLYDRIFSITRNTRDCFYVLSGQDEFVDEFPCDTTIDRLLVDPVSHIFYACTLLDPPSDPKWSRFSLKWWNTKICHVIMSKMEWVSGETLTVSNGVFYLFAKQKDAIISVMRDTKQSHSVWKSFLIKGLDVEQCHIISAKFDSNGIQLFLFGDLLSFEGDTTPTLWVIDMQNKEVVSIFPKISPTLLADTFITLVTNKEDTDLIWTSNHSCLTLWKCIY